MTKKEKGRRHYERKQAYLKKLTDNAHRTRPSDFVGRGWR